MARTNRVISLDAHAESVRERLLRYERCIELGQLTDASNHLVQAVATIEAMKVMTKELC